MLPGMDGLTFCRLIREMPADQQPVVLMVTAQNRPEDLKMVLEAGADDYIAKPIEAALIGVQLAVAERRVEQLELPKAAEADRERYIVELKNATTKITALQGLLPICSSCKKIRHDNGYWQQIEDYVGQHSGADFTHGICPECALELYPDLVNKNDKPSGAE